MTQFILTLDNVRAALGLYEFDALTAHGQMAPYPRGNFEQAPQPKEAGVLVLLYPAPDGELHLVLTRRNEGLRGHSGQVSFPGGRRDPDDISFEATALRETCEELGLCEIDVTILGHLTPIYIPVSHFLVHPVVAYTPTMPDFVPNPHEVAEVLSAPLWALLDPRYKAEEYRSFQNIQVKVPYYDLCGHKVWGATAVMLSEFEHRLHRVLV